MKNKILYILAPNDRFNYGDLIFPYVITHYIGSQFDEIHYISTTKSDLSYLGGIPTESYEVLYNANRDQCDNYLIIAGGESLFATWSTIISYVDNQYYRIKKIILKLFFFRKSIGLKVCKLLLNLIFAPKTQYPFTVSKRELSNFKGIYYNSVGGVKLSKLENLEFLKSEIVQDIFKDIDYISVRDNLTSKSLLSVNIKNKLVADSAILMSEVFNDSFFKNSIISCNNYVSEPYIYFQGNLHYLKIFAKQISSQLHTLQSQTGLFICLCPIGTAFGHEDHVGLDYLEPYLKDNNVKYVKVIQPDMYDIMYLIKNSALYIGSSLHGVITSMSFSIPYIGYGPKKVNAYIETWGEEWRYINDINEICNIALCSLKSNPDIIKLNEQKQTVRKSFDTIISNVNSKLE